MAEDGETAAPRSLRERLRVDWQVKWVVTLAGAVAMTIIAGILVWNVVTAPHPLAQLMPGYTQAAQHRVDR